MPFKCYWREIVKIEIKYETFNSEFHANIQIKNDTGIVFDKYIASNNLKSLFEILYEIAKNNIECYSRETL